MTGLTISLLGAFQVTLDGLPITHFRTRKVQALLAYLAVERGLGSGRRESLMELLWPGLPQKSAQINLRQVVYNLRKLIPPLPNGAGEPAVEFLLADHSRLQINPAYPCQVDALAIRDLLQQTHRHAHRDLLTCPECHLRLREAVGLYQGDFLADFYLDDSVEFEEWATATREAVRRQALDALEALASIHLRQKDYPQARRYAERQLQLDNLRESAYGQLMKALALSGQRSEALALYQSCRRLLAKELGMTPTAQTTALYEKIQAGEISLEASPSEGVSGYELREQLGAGAYGAVYRAYQPSIGREAAIKVILPQYANDAEFIRRFEAEAQTVARLEHPHIAPLYDYWREPDGAFLVMRLFRGGSLRSALQLGPTPPEKAVKLTEQIASALAALHSAGIVHQNIKPTNILLDEDGNAYLADFGISMPGGGAPRSQAASPDINIRASMAYRAPEQAADQPLSPQTDLYSLGLVLYEALTGALAFAPTPSAGELRLPPVSAVHPDLPSQVDAVLQRATATHPKDRYPDAQTLAGAFRQALLGGGAPAQESPRATGLFPYAMAMNNPYKGLRAFEETDAADFYGREALVERLVERLSESRFLAVVGPSGSGKSSAICAGLIPALRAGAAPGSARWFIAVMTPGANPLEALQQALLPIAINPPPTLIEPMLKDERGLLRILPRILPDGPNAQLLLVIDQFEELYTLLPDDRRRTHFIDSLLAAVHAPRSLLRVIITLRADFYDRPLQYQPLGELFKQHTEVVLPLSPAELERAVRIPPERCGVGLEPGLMALIAGDVRAQPGALPLLQYALTELYEARQEHTMTKSAYQAMGGVAGALSRQAEALFRALDEDDQAAARQLFLRLVTLGEGVEDTRRRVLRSELVALADPPTLSAAPIRRPDMEAVIDTFGRRRLLTFDRDPVTRSPTVEVAHEFLLREWPRLRGWLDVSRADVLQQRRLASAAADWQQAKQDPDFLLTGSRLEQFAGWAEATNVALTPEERTFLEISLAQRQARQAEEEARRQRELETARKLAEAERARAEEQVLTSGRLRRRGVFLSAALAVAAALAIVAGLLGRQANLNALHAQREARLAFSRELAAASISNLEIDAERSVLLALEAIAATYPDDKSWTVEAENALHRAVQALPTQLTLTGHKDILFDAAISPDGARVATASGDGTAKIWDAAAGTELLTLAGNADQLNSIAYSPNGAYLATGARNGLVSLWDAATGQLLFEWNKHQGPIRRLTFSPDGTRLATASQDRTAKIWDVESGQDLLTLKGHQHIVTDVAFSPDGKTLVTASGDRTVKIWDAASGVELTTLSGHQDGVLRLVLSPDGTRLASAARDGTIMVWAFAGGTWQELISVPGQGGAVLDLAFSPNGGRLVTAGEDGAARLWDALNGGNQELMALSGNAGALLAVAFSPDGKRLATGSGNGAAVIWDALTGRELFTLSGHTGRINRLVFSQDGKHLVSASQDTTARIWDIFQPAGKELFLLEGHTNRVVQMAFSPDGNYLATSSDDQTVILWDLSVAGQARLTLTGHGAEVSDVAFSPDGARLATASMDGIVRVWESASGRLLLTIINQQIEPGAAAFQTGSRSRVAFSPDGARLAVTRDQGSARVWDASTGEELLTLSGHEGLVAGIAFSPDGALLATAGDDRTAKLWDAATGAQLRTLTGHTGALSNLAFSPDGKLLATASRDSTAKVWDVASGQELFSITGHTGSVNDIAFSADGKTIATVSGDGLAKVWDAANGQEKLSLSGNAGDIFGLALSPDGTRLATGGRDRLVRVYLLRIEELVELARSRLTRAWRPEECRAFLHTEQCPSAP